ncbi:MAG: hypothetical protein KAI08_15580 [Bacteroidales bacterium]|nr:hypothetical protein [Bacteroidales bacterium]
MKKKSAFLVIICLFLGAVFTQISAQTFQGWASFGFGTEVYCDGELTDYVEGVMRVHWVFHEGEEVWQILQVKGIGSSASGEEFKYKEKDKKDDFADAVVYYHYNLKGNEGNHYIGTAKVDLATWTFTPIHTVCN